MSPIGHYDFNFDCVNQDAVDAVEAGICHEEIEPLVPVPRFQEPGFHEESHSTLF